MTPEEFKQRAAAMGFGNIAAKVGVTLPTINTQRYLDAFLTNNFSVQKIKEAIITIAPTMLPVIILGETGTGKELLAQALHGERLPNKFIPVNCAGIPDTLLEAEFFGCVKGAYTGAYIDRTGYVKEAEGGTLFLDEIGDMPLLMQSKLLRLLQSGKYRRVGSPIEETTNFRVIAATNKLDLDNNPMFRLDLYYRLAGIELKIPPLSERPEDVELIIAKFSKSAEIADKVFTSIHGEKLKGNVRQLLNIIERHNILCQTNVKK